MVDETERDKAAAESRSKYEVIADDFRAMISNGRLAPGAQLPSEKAESERRGVAIETVRRAYRALVQEGLIEKRHGAGTFVYNWRPIVRNIGKRFSSEVWGAGQSVWSAETEGREYGTDELKVFRGPVPGHLAELIREPTAWIRERRHSVDKRPVMLSASYYPASIVTGSPIAEPDTGPGGAPARLADLGHAPRTERELFRPRFATEEERRRLNLPKGSFVSEFRRVVRDEQGLVVEVTEMAAAGDAYVFQVDYTS
jgi:GntR family transcriptional regulator